MVRAVEQGGLVGGTGEGCGSAGAAAVCVGVASPRRMGRPRAARPLIVACAASVMLAGGVAGESEPRQMTESTTTSAASQGWYTNRLIDATSPYLLQHAHNPVDWYPWGSEALERARREDKPIFLSIGYAACHWCHVMERESFENEETARILREHFISIKVDREERPDLDDLYMTATLVYTQGHGGWPMSVFLLPDGRPFFAGTYFPPESAYGRPGFADLLRTIGKLWKEDRSKITAGAEALTEAVRRLSVGERGEGVIAAEAVSRAVAGLARAFDRRTGGVVSGGTNKFPPSLAMELMLREHARQRSSEAAQGSELLELVELTLDHMARGGIYDQLGGGIARYSTDVEWLVPHFEKMLYDQALVGGIYLDAYQVSGKSEYARIAREILDYVIGDLQAPEGGFYCARDADSEGVEGRYYVWSRAEVQRLLGENAELFCGYYDVTEVGNWEGHNILHVPRDVGVVARLAGLSTEEVQRRLEASRRKLLAARALREPPLRDDKVLASWNGLMIATMARGGSVLDEPRYVAAAENAAAFVLAALRNGEGRLLRTWRAGKAHTLGYLDDHAFLIEGLLNLYESTGGVKWLEQAVRLADEVERHFGDAEGGYFFTPDDGEALLVRSKEAADGAVPSGNSVHLMNLLRLAVLFDDGVRRQRAERVMACFAPQVSRSPASSERLLAGVDFYHRRPHEIAIVVPAEGDVAGLAALRRELWRRYLPNRVVATAREDAISSEAVLGRVRLLAGKKALRGKATAYVCRDFVCQSPTTGPAAFGRQLDALDQSYR